MATKGRQGQRKSKTARGNQRKREREGDKKRM